LEDASVSMLKYLRKRGGDYFEFIHEMGKIDEDKFWEAYEK